MVEETNGELVGLSKGEPTTVEEEQRTAQHSTAAEHRERVEDIRVNLE